MKKVLFVACVAMLAACSNNSTKAVDDSVVNDSEVVDTVVVDTVVTDSVC